MNINRYTSLPSAFISSTFIDLKEERRIVANTLLESGINVNALDIKPASNDSARDQILRGIEESDFIIVIIGERYGTIDRKITKWPKLSITRWEYQMGVGRFKKDALVYFKQISSPEQFQVDDYGDDFNKKRNLLSQFKKQLREKHNPGYFSNASELAFEIKKALIPTYRLGVRDLLLKVESLQRENSRLKNEIETLKDRQTDNTDYDYNPTNSAVNALLTGRANNALLGPERPTQNNALLGLTKKPPQSTGLLGYPNSKNRT